MNLRERDAALAAFRPDRFGFRADGDRWTKAVDGLGTIVVAPLGWQHARTPSYDRVDGDRVPMNALGLLVALQQRTWGMAPEELVPVNMLSVLPETGGSILVAYDPHHGFNADGWLGFIFGAGARSGVLVSHMLGVRGDLRGAYGIGWMLKVIQGYEALKTGHSAMVWTFDPMRGVNARLNLEKLGSVADAFTIDKYGRLRSELYGNDVPTDRLHARWNLLDPCVAHRLQAVHAARHQPIPPEELAGIPEITPETLNTLRQQRPMKLRYGVPTAVDELMRQDPGAVTDWRQRMRQALSAFLPTHVATMDESVTDSVAATRVQEGPSDYAIRRFGVGPDTAGERRGFYVLERNAR